MTPTLPHGIMLVGLLIALSALPVAPHPADAVAKPRGSRATAPDFTLTDSNGSALKLSAFKDKVVLLDFWATWCHGCKIEIPWYVEFQNKYKERGLSAIGVSMDDDGWKSVKPFLQQNKLNYPVVIGNEGLGKQFGVESMPVTLLIDRDGKIAESHAGFVDKNSFEQEILELLDERAKSGE
jgi:peroxiredoxin